MRNTRLEPRTKILTMLIAGCLVILLDSPTALLVCFLGSLTLIVVSIPTWRQIGLLCTFLFFTTWGLIYSQAIFYNEFPQYPAIYARACRPTAHREDNGWYPRLSGGFISRDCPIFAFQHDAGHRVFHRLDDATPRSSLGIDAIARAIYTCFYGHNGAAFHSGHCECGSDRVSFATVKRVPVSSAQSIRYGSRGSQQFSSNLGGKYSACHASQRIR